MFELYLYPDAFSITMQRLRIHIFFWCLYVAFKTYLNISADSTELLASVESDWNLYLRLFITQLVLLTIKVPLVYSCFYLLDRYLIHRWSLWETGISILTLFVLAVVGMTALNHYLILPIIFEYTGPRAGMFAVNSLLYHFFTLAFIAGIASTIRLMRRQHRYSLREVVLQKEKTEAELKYLKGQINPHFLFNTLNNIYSLARRNSPQTAESVLKLSKLMRFMLYNTNQSTILLSDELGLIEDYLSLERLRYTDRLRIAYTKSIDNEQQRIAPLLLIHFVENAFKHGASESRFNSFIDIDIQLQKGILTACIFNSKNPEAQSTELSSSIGLDNIKRQLELVYPTHELKIQNNVDTFQVDLQISLSA